MLSFGFVSAAPPAGGAPLPDASAAAGAPGDMAAFDAALASTLAVIEQESQQVPAPAPDEDPVVPAEWLLSSFFAVPAAAAPVAPEPVPGENGEMAAVDPALAGGVAIAPTSDGSAIGMPVVTAPVAVTVPAVPQAPSPEAAAGNAGHVRVAAQSGVPGPASGNPGGAAPANAAELVADPGTRVADTTAGVRTPAVAGAAGPKAAEATVEDDVQPASNEDTQASAAPKDATPRAAAGVGELPAPGAAVPVTGAATIAQASAVEAPRVVAAATIAPETPSVSVNTPAPTATGDAQVAFAAAREAVTASSAPTGVPAPAQEIPDIASMPGEQHAALAAATAPNVPARSTPNNQSAGAVEIRVGAAVEQASGGQQAAAGDGGPSQEQGRPSQEFMRFAAALAQVTTSQNGARPAADAAPRSVDMPVTAAAAVTPAAPPVAVAAAAPASAATAPPPSADAENVGRLVQAMRVSTRAGGWEATVRLNPDHLGDVTIALRVDRNTVSAVVNAEAPGVRQWLESQEQAVRSGMAEHGLQLERFVVQRDGQRKDAQPQQHQQEPRRQPQKRDQAAARFEVVV